MHLAATVLATLLASWDVAGARLATVLATTKSSVEANSSKIDWEPYMKTFRQILQDRKHHRMVVYETDGETLTMLAKPGYKCVSWDAFKEWLKACGPRGKVCIGMFIFNFPSSVGSRSMIPKTILVKAQDPDRIRAAVGLGSSTRVQTVALMHIWKPLLDKFSAMPSVVLSSDAEVDAIDIWKFLTHQKAPLLQETQSFMKDFPSTNNRVAKLIKKGKCKLPQARLIEGHGDDDDDDVDDALEAPEASTMFVESMNDDMLKQPQALVREEMKGETAEVSEKIEHKVLQAVEKMVDSRSKELGKIAKQAAQSEVGQALRVLARKQAEATKTVADTWAAKANQR